MTKTVRKEIARLNKIPHPKGRKAAQLSKNVIKAEKRKRVKLLYQMKANVVGEKLMWFKENLDPIENYTPELVIQLIERYLGRFDEELLQIQLKHTTGGRKGRQHASREDTIKMTIKNERNDYHTSGIEIPDLLNSNQLCLLKNWSGELRFLQNFKLVRYNKAKLESMKNSIKCSTTQDKNGEHSKKENVNTSKTEELKEKKNVKDNKLETMDVN